ncbi:hypothetical protein [Streptomyces sp. NPDC058268]|uniref:hypothetical protein n=1 Tax=Streptomyces sp. NPDC058268 TaxID=3346413 RepID=UPI0036F15324
MNTPQPAGPYGQFPPPVPVPPPNLPGRTKRGWIPLAIGAAAASLVWAAVLVLSSTSSTAAPDPRGYAVSANLCKDASTTGIGSLFTAEGDQDAVVKHKVVDRSECYRELEPKDASKSSMSASLFFTMHKETDPAPEVIAEAESAGYAPGSKATVKKIPGLGDHAYLITTDLDSTRMLTLHVIDGGAEYAARITGSDFSSGDKSRLYSTDKLQPLLVQDAKATLARLKK